LGECIWESGGYKEGGYKEGGYKEGGYKEGGYKEGVQEILQYWLLKRGVCNLQYCEKLWTLSLLPSSTHEQSNRSEFIRKTVLLWGLCE